MFNTITRIEVFAAALFIMLFALTTQAFAGAGYDYSTSARHACFDALPEVWEQTGDDWIKCNAMLLR